MVIIYRYPPFKMNGNYDMACDFGFPDDLCLCGCNDIMFTGILLLVPSGKISPRGVKDITRLRSTNLTVNEWEI